jgi:hypothetical protein
METVEATGHLTPELLAEFEANAKRPLKTRMCYAFLQTYKPVLDDARYRSFDTMEEYRRWCNEKLPEWLGYRIKASWNDGVRISPGSGNPAYFCRTSGSIFVSGKIGSDSAWVSRHHARRWPYVDKQRENCNALIPALHELGFELNETEDEEIRRGKDFVQLKNGPFDLDLIFAPDGIERFEDAWSRRIDVEGFPVCHLDDIIASKRTANRKRTKSP